MMDWEKAEISVGQDFGSLVLKNFLFNVPDYSEIKFYNPTVQRQVLFLIFASTRGEVSLGLYSDWPYNADDRVAGLVPRY